MLASASASLHLGFSALVAAVSAMLVGGVWISSRRCGLASSTARRQTTLFGAALIGWLVVTGALAWSGVLANFESLPPRMFFVVGGGGALTTWLALSSVGKRLASGLPIWALVGSQAFRLPLELLMHRAFRERLMPVQMSFEGRNFDIVTGVTAIVVAAIAARRKLPAWGLMAWNLLGLALLINIVTIAILSFPTPFRVFLEDPPNTWVTAVPFVWLPALLVMTALLGHLLIGRRALELIRGQAKRS